MDEKTERLLDQIAQRPEPSKLEQHRELIAKLRKKRLTYQEIADIFRTEYNLGVAPSTIHHFVRIRAKGLRKQFELPPPSRPAAISTDLISTSDARARIEAFKRRKRTDEPLPPPQFEYTEGEPLILMPETDKENNHDKH